MAKRELPPRNNRGKNTFYTKEIDKFQEQKTKAVSLKKKRHSETQTLTSEESTFLCKAGKAKSLVQLRRQLYNENKKEFKFTRGIHYFYDLGKLERVANSVSYVIFPSKKQQKASKTNPYTITYSKQKQIIGNRSIFSLINRNYIGLPQNQSEYDPLQNNYVYNQKTIHEVIEMKRNDKNPCHHYLFQAEDKQHNLDRMIAQLTFILKKIDFYLVQKNVSKLKQFSIVEKDQFLAQSLFQKNNLTKQQKKQALQQKIQTLKAKRDKLSQNYSSVSETYFHNSLDQKLYNLIKLEKQKLTRFSIYSEMEKSIKAHQNSVFTPENSLILENYHHFHESALSIDSEIDNYYCIDQKKLDPFILGNVLKLISIRLFQEGENCFYFAKKIFLKLFSKELKLDHEIRPVNFEQYSNKMKDIEESLSKFWAKKHKHQTVSNQRKQTSLGKNARKAKSLKKMKVQTLKEKIKLKINEKFVPIDFYEFHCLKLFTALYDSLNLIKDFLERSQNKRLNIVQQMGSLFYPKLESKLVGIIQIPEFGLLSEALDKLIDVILHPKKEFQPMNYELYVQFLEKDKQIVTFLKQIDSRPQSESSSVYKRVSSISQFESEIQENLIGEKILCHGRKMVK